MKKIVAAMLCAALLLGCAAALAETTDYTTIGKMSVNGLFEIRGVLPQGYTMETSEMENGGLMASITSEDPAKPMMILSIMFNEMYADVATLDDVDAEGIARLESTFTNEYDVEISYTETEHGTKLMVVKEKKGLFGDVYTIYQGFEIEFIVVPSEEGGAESITDEQFQMVIKFLSDMEIVPIAE